MVEDAGGVAAQLARRSRPSAERVPGSESTTWAELSLDDYAEQSASTRAAWQSMNGKQGGAPAKLAAPLITVIDTDTPPPGGSPAPTPCKQSRKSEDTPRAGRRLPRALQLPRHDDA